MDACDRVGALLKHFSKEAEPETRKEVESLANELVDTAGIGVVVRPGNFVVRIEQLRLGDGSRAGTGESLKPKATCQCGKLLGLAGRMAQVAVRGEIGCERDERG